MKLWDHQARGLAELTAAIAAGVKRICVTAPTGGGKSLMLSTDMQAHGLSSAVYTDRRMLLDQLSRGLEDAGFGFGVRAAGVDPRLLDDIQLCSLQTEVSRVLKGSREVHRCKRVYVDEAHKQKEATAQAIIEKHLATGAVIVGLTATPLGIGHMYDQLVIAGTNSELRKCGALVPAYHYGPDEPDVKWVGQVKIDGGECGIPEARRMDYCHRVFGRVLDQYKILNPEGRPALLFAPGIQESLWFAKMLTSRGIPSAHIDGANVWLDGQERDSDTDARTEIAERSESGEIKVVCNRFVLREGIDWPWIYHGIFATVFGSLLSYLQAGGRMLRAHPSMQHVIIQDHGGGWWRHGSLNSDRCWELDDTNRIVAGVREQNLREKKEPEPIVCPRCNQIRLSGPECPKCGMKHTMRTRMVMQKDGSLREMKGDIFRKRQVAEKTKSLEDEWRGYVFGVQKSKKPSVMSLTFSQLESNFAKRHNWKYPPRDMSMMPVKVQDWFRPVAEVRELTR